MKKRNAIASAIALVLAAVILAPVEGRARETSRSAGSPPPGASEFCAPRLARNFLQPLAKLPPVRRVPSSGKLSFAPKGMTLEPRGGRLVVGQGSVGFGFSDDAVGQLRHLNWNISAQLVKINRRGATVAELSAQQRRIGSIGGNRIKDFLFLVGGEPAFYRVDISISHSESHQLLGMFSRYVRLVRPRFDARLLMLGSVARQGEVLSVRLANFGTETVSSLSYDWRFAVQRFNGQGWITAPSNPPAERHRRIVRKLQAGRMSECIHFLVPTDEDPGLYRFSVQVNRTSESTDDRTVQLTAEFEITGREPK